MALAAPLAERPLQRGHAVELPESDGSRIGTAATSPKRLGISFSHLKHKDREGKNPKWMDVSDCDQCGTDFSERSRPNAHIGSQNGGPSYTYNQYN